MFPGKGSQYLGMGREFLAADPQAGKMLEQAEDISGLPLRRLRIRPWSLGGGQS